VVFCDFVIRAELEQIIPGQMEFHPVILDPGALSGEKPS
jgi:hypothetical protein